MIHGFSGHTCFIPDHEKEDYKRHFSSFRDDYKPKGRTEEFLVQSLAELSWSTQQIRAVSNNVMSLLGLRNDPFHAPDDSMAYNLAQAAHIGDRLKEINLLGIYEQRKLRLFNTTRKELLQVQAERKLAEKEELEPAAQLRKACKSAYQARPARMASRRRWLCLFSGRNRPLHRPHRTPKRGENGLLMEEDPRRKPRLFGRQ